MKSHIFSRLIFVALTTAWMAAEGEVPALTTKQVLEPKSNCVAYLANETRFLVSRRTVIGRNCEIQGSLVAEGAGMSRLEIQIPISGFKSDDPDRDIEVAKLLGRETQPNLVFKIPALPNAAFTTLLKGSGLLVKGTLSIAGREFEIETTTAFTGSDPGERFAMGVIKTRFSFFSISVPRVGPFGAIARADDEVELHFNFDLNKIKGFSETAGENVAAR